MAFDDGHDKMDRRDFLKFGATVASSLVENTAVSETKDEMGEVIPSDESILRIFETLLVRVDVR